MKTELLAPAGNFAKLKTALHFGADAVYLGGKQFSLRTFADNFTTEEMLMAVNYAHARGKKVYVTSNIYAKNADFVQLKEYFERLQEIGVDGVIVSDTGVLYVAKKTAPNLSLHISTQANTTNKYAVKFWQEQGASRVVLARELSLAEIGEIHDFVPEMELEAFVHGAMCISYSGRCLLSDYLDGRQSNRGACVQACRWKYEVRALNATNGKSEWLPIEEDGKGTYVFNSKDLNMLSRIDEMQNVGVNSFKIEGRMKSGYYLATVINAYRLAMDGADRSVSEKELLAIQHRDYTKAYADGENKRTVNYQDSQSKGDYTYVADVIDCENGRIKVEMRNRFKVGETLEILSPDENFRKTFTVQQAWDSQGETSDDCKRVQEIYTINCPYELKKGDYLRRKNG